MDEAEWLVCENPEALLGTLKGRASDRKLRLFTCACCRHIWDFLKDAQADGTETVEVAERFADGRSNLAELEEAFEEVAFHADWDRGLGAAASACLIDASEGAAEVFTYVVYPDWREWRGPKDPVKEAAERRAEAVLLRCIFGNPFQPLPHRSFPSHVVGLAQSCYAAFPEVSEEFLILADALEDLGEGAAAAHCREKVHVKGCHIIDWILGKS